MRLYAQELSWCAIESNQQHATASCKRILWRLVASLWHVFLYLYLYFYLSTYLSIYTVYLCIFRKADRARPCPHHASRHVNHGINIIPIHRIHAAALSGSSPPATCVDHEEGQNSRMETHADFDNFDYFPDLYRLSMFVPYLTMCVLVFSISSLYVPHRPLCCSVVRLRCCCTTEKDKSLSTRTCKWHLEISASDKRGSWYEVVHSIAI